MKLSKIKIANFKGFGEEPQEIPIRPITLLFGQNSCGKSSILQSLLLGEYASDIGGFDLKESEKWGESMDLGGFAEYINGKDPKKDLTLEYEFERSEEEMQLDASETERVRAIQGEPIGQEVKRSFHFFNKAKNLGIQFKIGLTDGSPKIKQVTVLIDGEEYISFVRNAANRLSLDNLNLDNSFISKAKDNFFSRFEVFLQYLSEQKDGNDLDFDMADQPPRDDDYADEVDYVTSENQPDYDPDEEEYHEDRWDMPESYERDYERYINSLSEEDYIEDDSEDEEIETEETKEALKEKLRKAVLERINKSLPFKLSKDLSGLRISGLGFNLEVEEQDKINRQYTKKTAKETELFGDEQEIEEETFDIFDDPIVFFYENLRAKESISFAPKLELLRIGALGDPTVKVLTQCFCYDTELILEAIFDSLKHQFTGMKYLGPNRMRLSRDHLLKARSRNWLSEGGDAWDLLQHVVERDPNKLDGDDIGMLTEAIDKLNYCMKSVLGLNYQIQVNAVYEHLKKWELKAQIEYAKHEHSDQGKKFEEVIERLMKYADKEPTTIGFVLHDPEKNCSFHFNEVGFGLSQLMPIVVYALYLENSNLLVEQPELHIHPGLQAKLADVLIMSVNIGGGITGKCRTLEGDTSAVEDLDYSKWAKKLNNHFIIETHSEHLILRLLRRVRETCDPEYTDEECPFPLKPEDISVVYVDSDDGYSKVTALDVTNDGDFKTDWPKGFFEERFEDLP